MSRILYERIRKRLTFVMLMWYAPSYEHIVRWLILVPWFLSRVHSCVAFVTALARRSGFEAHIA